MEPSLVIDFDSISFLGLLFFDKASGTRTGCIHPEATEPARDPCSLDGVGDSIEVCQVVPGSIKER